MTAKEYLNRYRRINAEIDCKLEEIARYRSMATRLSPTARFDKNGNVTDKVGRAVAKIVDLETEINSEINELINIREDIIRTISAIDNTDVRTVLEYRYINGWSWQKIATKMNYTRDHLTGYLHRKALRTVGEIIKKMMLTLFNTFFML